MLQLDACVPGNGGCCPLAQLLRLAAATYLPGRVGGGGKRVIRQVWPSSAAFPSSRPLFKLTLLPDSACAGFPSQSWLDMERMLLSSWRWSLPRPWATMAPTLFCRGLLPREAYRDGPRPLLAPAWLLPGLGGALMLPCPNESGSSGHPGSAFKEGRQPFPQPVHSHGFWNRFGFLTRKRRECYCILTLKKSSSDLYSHHGVQATWKSFSGPLSSSALLRNWGMGWGGSRALPPPRLRERLQVGNSPEMGSSEVLF